MQIRRRKTREISLHAVMLILDPSSYLILSCMVKSVRLKVFQEVNSIMYFTAGNIRKPLSLWVVTGRRGIVGIGKFFGRGQLGRERWKKKRRGGEERRGEERRGGEGEKRRRRGGEEGRRGEGGEVGGEREERRG